MRSLTFLYVQLQIDPKKRPSFIEIVQTLEEIKQRSQMATVLADISNLNLASDDVMSKTILEKILGLLNGSKKPLVFFLYK